jgi:glycosyltransferase involved in cell wall biosynthesis
MPDFPLSVLRYLATAVLGMAFLVVALIWRRARIIVAQSPYEGAVAAVVKLGFRCFGVKIAVAVESHGDFQNSLFLYRRIPGRRFLRPLMGVVARFGLRHADVLRAVSNTTARQLAKVTGPKTIFEFAAWTDIDVFVHAKSDMPQACRSTVVFVGSLAPIKGVHYLVEAFANVAFEMPDLKLLIVGDELNANYAQELKRMCNACGLNERVCFCGAVPQSRVAQYMAHAALVVLPSLSEGYSRVAVETMAAGAAFVATAVGGIPEVVGGAAVLVPSGDVDSLTREMRRLLWNPIDRDHLAQAGRLRASQHYHSDAFIDGYGRLFRHAGSLVGPCAVDGDL